MPSLALVRVHESQFPERVTADFVASLRNRQVNHKFHYDSVKQTQKWLGLHQAYSPSRTDPECGAVYDAGFAEAASRLNASPIQVVGLGCGGGQKDARLIRRLHDAGRNVTYVPIDVSLSMVLVAQQTVANAIPGLSIHPVVCDLIAPGNLPEVLDGLAGANVPRIITFLGMIPNFEPGSVLAQLKRFLRPDDLMVLSANLAPGRDYLAGIQKILPLYDNGLTRDWLMTFLTDLGVEPADGELKFGIEDDPGGKPLKRIAAYFYFSRPRRFAVQSEEFEFHAGDKVRLFYSYRHTPSLLAGLLKEQGLEVLREWVTRSEEEGVFLVKG